MQRHTRIWGWVLVAAIAVAAYTAVKDPDGGEPRSLERAARPARSPALESAPVQRVVPRTREPIPELERPSVHPMILYKSAPQVPGPDRLTLPIRDMERQLRDLRR